MNKPLSYTRQGLFAKLSILFIIALLAACGSPFIARSPTPAFVPTPVSPATVPTVIASSPAVTATRAPIPQSATPTQPPPLDKAPTMTTEVVTTGLVTPWAIDFAPDGRMFVTERSGRIRIVKNGQLQSDLWMTLPVAETGESGLLGIALDPQFAQNHFVYVAYTYRASNGRLQNRLVRLREDANGKGVPDKILLDGAEGNGNHDGGRVKFGPDGKLYWTMGEAGNTELAQDRTSLNGKILRLNSDGSIPADNPFPNSPVYSYGHRNPQGLAWQPGTGRLYATEHGPSSAPPNCCRDEVNLIEPGKNYGWPLIMGSQTREGMISPIIHSGDNTIWAPSGAAFVTRGAWTGSFLFAGLRGLALYRLTFDAQDPRKIASLDPLFERQFGRLREVIEGPDGAIYFTTSNRDGRGSPARDDDRVIRLIVK